MRIGHSLRRRIDDGIRSSRFGVVILSDAFLHKGWTNHELTASSHEQLLVNSRSYRSGTT
jgi:hypothetical protein